MIKYVHLFDVAGKHVIINVHKIRLLTSRNAEHVNVHFDNEHIQVVRGPLSDVLERIEDA